MNEVAARKAQRRPAPTRGSSLDDGRDLAGLRSVSRHRRDAALRLLRFQPLDSRENKAHVAAGFLELFSSAIPLK
jgi:hypothetical protein